jgi:surface protein
MFKDSLFNQDISNWNVGNVYDMRGMFYGSQFNGDISKWDVSNVELMDEIFDESEFIGNIDSWEFNLYNVSGLEVLSKLKFTRIKKFMTPDEKPRIIIRNNSTNW